MDVKWTETHPFGDGARGQFRCGVLAEPFQSLSNRFKIAGSSTHGQAQIYPYTGRQVDHARKASSTVRNVVPSTPAPMRSRSPVASTSSRAVSSSCRTGPLSTKDTERHCTDVVDHPS